MPKERTTEIKKNINDEINSWK